MGVGAVRLRSPVHPVEGEELAPGPANTIRTMRVLALTLAAVAAVSGCGGSSGDKPRTLPAVTASSSPSPSAGGTAAASDVPAEAQAPTSAGAEAFARFFYTETKRAFESKNPDLIKAISAPGCTSCDNYIASITLLRDNNERVENFTVTVLSAVAPALAGSTARVDVSWSSPEVLRYDASGKVIMREGPFKRVDDQMNLVRRGDSWVIAQLKSRRIVK